MNLNRSFKIALVALAALQNVLAGAQTGNTTAPVDYSKFSSFIAQRNIFDPNRVPNVPWVPRTNRPVAYTPPRQPDSFSLVGVIGYGEGKMAGVYAFFDGTSQQYRKTVQLNGSIASFKIADIAADSVTLVTGTNTQTVLKIGEQLHDDGNGHWLTASGNDVRYSNTSSRFGNRNGFGNGGFGSRRRNGFGGNNGNNGNFNSGNYNNNNNNGGFNRSGNNNYGGVTAPASDNSQTQDQNTGDFNNSPPDMIILQEIMPQDFNSEPDNTPPDPGQQN